MSDAGGSTPVSNVRVRIQDEFFNSAAPFVPDDGPIGGPPDPLFRPRNWGGLDDIFPAPAPQTGALYTSTSAFKGENPNGDWKLYVVDDSPSNAGLITGGWMLDLRTTDANVFTAIPGSGENGPAAPYPNVFEIPSNLRGRIKKVRVRLQALSHTWPDDIDILLQGPGGQTVLLMSDAGGRSDAINVDLTFDDAGPPLPDEGILTSGTFRPTNYESTVVDFFPAPAPAPPYGTALSVFNNTLPVGTWRLWVVDAYRPNVGHLHNWAVEIQTVDKGDFDRDNQTDLLWTHVEAPENVLWYMNGLTLRDGEFTILPPQPEDRAWKIVGTDDFNGDGKNDVLWSHPVTGENYLSFMDKHAMTGGTPIFNTIDLSWEIVATGDFNGDAKPDILWRDDDVGGHIFVSFMDGSTLLGGAFLSPAEPNLNWRIVGTGYFDNDTHRDIVLWNRVTGDVVVWYMNGIVRRHVQATDPRRPEPGWAPVAVGDFDASDNAPDIFLRHPDGWNAVWYIGGPLGATRVQGLFATPLDPRWRLVGPR
jgi:subtilisin-like proprotein convertase family protein